MRSQTPNLPCSCPAPWHLSQPLGFVNSSMFYFTGSVGLHNFPRERINAKSNSATTLIWAHINTHCPETSHNIIVPVIIGEKLPAARSLAMTAILPLSSEHTIEAKTTCMSPPYNKKRSPYNKQSPPNIYIYKHTHPHPNYACSSISKH